MAEHVPGPTTERLAVPGGHLTVDVAGTGPTVILLHEGIADRRMWDRELAVLAEDHRIVRYDLRGFGASSRGGAYSAVDDLSAVVRRVGDRRPIVVGPSVGGRIALDYALAHPTEVGGLLLVAPAVSGLQPAMVPEGAAAFAEDDRISQAAVAAWNGGDLPAAIEHLRGLWARALRGEALEMFRTMVGENAREVFEDVTAREERRTAPPAANRLGEIRVPATVLVGDLDNPASEVIARFVARGLPHAEFEVVPGADHLLNLSRPDAFDEALARLLDRTEDRSPSPRNQSFS